MNSKSLDEKGPEDPETLGPGSLEDLGSSERLRIFTFTSNSHPRYDLGLNKGQFLGGLRFMLERYHEGSSAEEIMIALKNKHRDYPLAFVRKIVDGDVPTVAKGYLTPGDAKFIAMDLSGFALVLEYNRMGKSIPFIRERLEHHAQSFTEDFIQDLIRSEKQWELESLVDIHRQESMQSMLDYPLDLDRARI